MSAPSNLVQVQGVTTVSADNFNTFVQLCTTAAVLRSFIGLQNMEVDLQGIISVNDGLGGKFYWNGSSTSPDNGYSVIVPTGAATGAWIRLGPIVTTAGNLPSVSLVGVGFRAFVTDATLNTFGSTVAGGGGNKVPCFSDGVNWKIG